VARAGDDLRRLALLDTHLVGATQVVVDIHSRYRFETELCRRRRRTTLSVSELCGLMDEAQEASYGDGLHPDHRHPYMWAVKGHYFTPFYNWPYTFGLLFGLGLHARYRADAERFRAGYDDLLSSVGMADAATLAASFGIDIADRAFWEDSLATLIGHIDDHERLVDRQLGR
jgi:oligoendopeptidase F